jgi:hypothetical protein
LLRRGLRGLVTALKLTSLALFPIFLLERLHEALEAGAVKAYAFVLGEFFPLLFTDISLKFLPPERPKLDP